MLNAENIIALLLAYILGSIPTSVWVGKIFYDIDVREYGSGNAGATNTFRVLGKKAGIPVLIIDVLKGWLSVKLSLLFGGNFITEAQTVNFQLALGVASLMGHIFPVFAGFRGGKGIATLLGMMIAIHYQAASLSTLVFIVVFVTSRYVSLSSMIAAATFPIVIIVVFESTISSLIIFSLFISVLVLVTHQKNIERLIRREESKANIFKKKNKEEEEDIE